MQSNPQHRTLTNTINPTKKLQLPINHIIHHKIQLIIHITHTKITSNNTHTNTKNKQKRKNCTTPLLNTDNTTKSSIQKKIFQPKGHPPPLNTGTVWAGTQGRSPGRAPDRCLGWLGWVDIGFEIIKILKKVLHNNGIFYIYILHIFLISLYLYVTCVIIGDT